MDYRDPDWVAGALGVDKNTVYRFLQDGTIPAVQVGRKWLISERRLNEWLAAETDRQTRSRRDAATSAEHVVRRMDTFTADAKSALRRAHGEARRYAHPQLDPLHLLLGLADERKSVAARALRVLDVTPDMVRAAVEAKLTPGAEPAARRLARNPDAKRAMRLASRLALRANDGNPLSPVGSDHLLTGIFLNRRGLGHALLVEHGVTRQRLRKAVRTAERNEKSVKEKGDRS